MYENAVVYRGKTWRYALFCFVFFFGPLVLFSYWRQNWFSDTLFMFVPVAFITFYYEEPDITVYIVVSNDTVAAPSPDSGRKLKAASVQDIDLAQSRAPSFFRSGYLALSDGGRLILPWPYFNTVEAFAMLEDIARRQGDGAGVRKG